MGRYRFNPNESRDRLERNLLSARGLVGSFLQNQQNTESAKRKQEEAVLERGLQYASRGDIPPDHVSLRRQIKLVGKHNRELAETAHAMLEGMKKKEGLSGVSALRKFEEEIDKNRLPEDQEGPVQSEFELLEKKRPSNRALIERGYEEEGLAVPIGQQQAANEKKGAQLVELIRANPGLDMEGAMAKAQEQGIIEPSAHESWQKDRAETQVRKNEQKRADAMLAMEIALERHHREIEQGLKPDPIDTWITKTAKESKVEYDFRRDQAVANNEALYQIMVDGPNKRAASEYKISRRKGGADEEAELGETIASFLGEGGGDFAPEVTRADAREMLANPGQHVSEIMDRFDQYATKKQLSQIQMQPTAVTGGEAGHSEMPLPQFLEVPPERSEDHFKGLLEDQREELQALRNQSRQAGEEKEVMKIAKKAATDDRPARDQAAMELKDMTPDEEGFTVLLGPEGETATIDEDDAETISEELYNLPEDMDEKFALMVRTALIQAAADGNLEAAIESLAKRAGG